MMSLDQTLDKLRSVLSAELEQPRVNGLTELVGHKLRRTAITQYMTDIEAELEPLRKQIFALSSLPNEHEIQWAQAVRAMNTCYLEVETTGLTSEDEIVRVTTVNQRGEVECDVLIKPSRPLSVEASKANGLTDADLADAPSLVEVWERIQAALIGRYVLSYGQAFDLKVLSEAAARYHLASITIIGDDLQRHCTSYYNGEYYLRLAELCERVGHPLKSNSAVERAKGQRAILHAMAEGITDVRPMKKLDVAPLSTAAIENEEFSDSSLDEHPF